MSVHATGAAARPLTPDDIVHAVRHLPSAPRILPKLKRLLADCNSAIDDIVALIRLDPGLAAQVVRVGNSAYYSAGTSCSTVEQSVGRVGFDQIYGLVSYAVASQVLIRPVAAYGLEADAVWRQALACAYAAETLARHLGPDDSTAYTLGLLHGIGMVAIDEWALRERRPLTFHRDTATGTTTASELAQLGFTHGEAGAALLRHWGFSDEVCAAVRWQSAPAGAGRGTRLAALLHTAKQVGSAAGAPAADPPAPADPVLALLPLAAGSLPAITEEVILRLAAVGPLLAIAAEAPRSPAPECARFPLQPAAR